MSTKISQVKKALSDNEHLMAFAENNNLSMHAAKVLLERLVREPEESPEATKYVFSAESSPDLKGYAAGEDKGYRRGHEAGFAKGSALGVLAAASLLAAVKLRKIFG